MLGLSSPSLKILSNLLASLGDSLLKFFYFPLNKTWAKKHLYEWERMKLEFFPKELITHRCRLDITLVAQTVKNLPAIQETWVWSLSWEDPLEEEMATHSNILAWRIPWTEETGGLRCMKLQKSWTQLGWITTSITYSGPVKSLDWSRIVNPWFTQTKKVIPRSANQDSHMLKQYRHYGKSWICPVIIWLAKFASVLLTCACNTSSSL